MAKREMEKNSPEWNVFASVWNFWKKCGDAETADEYWQDVIKTGSSIALDPKYKECWDLSSELVNALLNVLDARAASIKQHGDNKHGYEIIQERLREAGRK